MATDEILSKYRQMFTPHPMPRVPRDLKDKRPAAPLLFSTASYEAREQFETYRSHVSSFLQVQPPQHARPADGFLAELLNVNLGKLILVSGHIAASTKVSLPRSARRSPVDHWWLTRARSGETWLEAGDRRIHARPGDIYLFSPDQDFRSRTTDYDILSLILPRAAFAPVADTLDRLSGTILAGNLAALLGDHLTSLETPLSAVRAVIHRRPDMQPLDHPVAECAALAKRDLSPGQTLGKIGERDYRGFAVTWPDARRDGALPIGLAEAAKVVKPIRAGEKLTYENCVPDDSLVVTQTRRRLDQSDARFVPGERMLEAATARH